MSPQLKRYVLALGTLLIVVWGGRKMMDLVQMPGTSFSGPLPALTEKEGEIKGRLKGHVDWLAGEIGERNVWHYSALEASARYIEGVLSGLGYPVYIQDFNVGGKAVKNIEVEKKGVMFPDEIILIGAHYDSVQGSPGANDNASGTAALLDLAGLLQEKVFRKTVRFVAFVNEEPPFSMTEHMGSRVYASRSSKRGERITAMVSIETIGFYSEEEDSQKYPFPFSYFYPKKANFIGFVGNISSKSLVHRSISSFRKSTPFPSEGVAAPEWITGIGWSDHKSFWDQGYPALMVTDTALFRYPYYHTPLDTPDKLDFERTARVVAGLAQVVEELAEPPPSF